MKRPTPVHHNVPHVTISGLTTGSVAGGEGILAKGWATAPLTQHPLTSTL